MSNHILTSKYYYLSYKADSNVKGIHTYYKKRAMDKKAQKGKIKSRVVVVSKHKGLREWKGDELFI